MKQLSILICTLEKRAALLERLMKILKPQLTDAVEILLNSDKGEKSIGTKRNELLDQATGRYIAFIDDDDRVAPTYVSRILAALKTEPDCVGMEGQVSINRARPRLFRHTRTCQEWCERGRIYYRSPNHLNPVKREIALKVRFPEINMGEDHDYSKRLLPHLNTEVYLATPIYFYDYLSSK